MDLTILFMTFLGFGFGAIMTIIAIILGKNKYREEKGIYAITVPGFNIGLFAYPLVQTIWGLSGMIYIIMFDVGNAFIVFGSSYFLAKYYKEGDAKFSIGFLAKILGKSVPFMSYMIGVAMSLSGLRFPSMAMGVIDVLAGANMPLALLLLGIVIQLRIEAKDLRTVGKIILTRYTVGALFGVLLYLMLPYNPVLSPMFLIMFVLPISMSSLPYSVQFNYDVKLVGTANNMTIILSFFIIWAISAFSF
ncbi:hypothetical protein SAMN02746064_02144 [Alkalibacter saccharofermentans DSM 14828]|uniref:Membrane transport protein n=2 Tax=Alkalibacter TaxID=274470 RepID=A0A1M4ZTS1_9FIRM|nr:hypothetical protein SAMN02746064_02144 [Alkalibacter saccharofermentans DSM 14828]